MITTYEELIQYVRKLEKALDVTENEGITTTEIGGHLEVDGNVNANNTPHLYQFLIKGVETDGGDNLELVVTTCEDISTETNIMTIFSKSLQYTPASVDGEWFNPYVAYINNDLIVICISGAYTYEINETNFEISEITLIKQLF